MNDSEHKTLTIRLRRITELFAVPERDPWDENPNPAESGLHQIARTWKLRDLKRMETLRIEIEKVPDADAPFVARAPVAWKNHCLALSERLYREARLQRKTGWRELFSLLPVTVVALALSAFFEQVQPFPSALNRLFSEGLVIIGWVMLWHPVEILIFDGGVPDLSSREMEVLAGLKIEVVPVQKESGVMAQ